MVISLAGELRIVAFTLGCPMDGGTWSTILGTLRESTIPSWSQCCNMYQKLTALGKATALAYGQTGSGMREQGRRKEVKQYARYFLWSSIFSVPVFLLSMVFMS